MYCYIGALLRGKHTSTVQDHVMCHLMTYLIEKSYKVYGLCPQTFKKLYLKFYIYYPYYSPIIIHVSSCYGCSKPRRSTPNYIMQPLSFAFMEFPHSSFSVISLFYNVLYKTFVLNKLVNSFTVWNYS